MCYVHMCVYTNVLKSVHTHMDVVGCRCTHKHLQYLQRTSARNTHEAHASLKGKPRKYTESLPKMETFQLFSLFHIFFSFPNSKQKLGRRKKN